MFSVAYNIETPTYDTEISEVTRYFTGVGLRRGKNYDDKFALSNGLNLWVYNSQISLQKGDKIHISFEDNGNIARVSTPTAKTYVFIKFSPVGYSYSRSE